MTHYVRGSTRPSAPETVAPLCAASGSTTVAATRCTITCTIARDAAHSPTEPASALEHRKGHPRNLYNTSAWEHALRCYKLTNMFPSLVHSLHHGFIIGYPVITCTQSPPNSTSIPLYQNEFENIVKKEIAKNRYIGPTPLATIESLLGPYQTSPFSMIPKLRWPGTFRLVQNFSFPINPFPFPFPNPSVNDAIDASLFPCTWGKFSTIYLLVSRLSLGSQAATRDIAEAYHTIPLHASQYPATVVRTSETHACIDTCAAFGTSPSGSAYRLVADAGAEILRTHGISPVDKWLNNYVFFRIPLTHLADYNHTQQQWHSNITHSGQCHTQSRIWYSGATLPSGENEEFSEGCGAPIKNLSRAFPQSGEDTSFSYCIADIDEISENLGIPWGISKDQPFTNSTIYIGFVWDIKKRTVTLSEPKVVKYAKAINEWLIRPKYNLKHIQELYGKLLHVASIIPQGCTYLMGLESMLSICAKKLFLPHRPDKSIQEDLLWWLDRILTSAVVQPIVPPTTLFDPHTFSDASSGVGIGIAIGTRWRAWRLRSDWSTLWGKKDIGWAEAIGFELLIRAT
jgi:hypothetical protein